MLYEKYLELKKINIQCSCKFLELGSLQFKANEEFHI